jgi:hypothetical protein
MHAAQKKAVIKAVNERGLLMRLWKRWRLDLFNAALEGPYQNDIQQLINILKRITLKEERKLISIVRKGPWLAAHKDIQFLVLRLIDAQLIALREKADLPPFDDALWGEPLTPFQIIRNHFLEKTHAG